MLDLQVVEAAFKLSHEQYISAPFAAKKISATGFDRIVVPPGVPPFSIPNSGIKNTPTRISLHAQLPKKLSISPIVLPEKTRVYIGPVGSDGTFMISISENTKPFTIPVTIPKIVNISGSSVSEHQIDVGRIRPVEFISATHENFDLTIYPTGENKSIFLNEIMINDFSILRFRDEEGAIPRVVSAVKSGDIFFQALDSKPHHLSPNDHFSINIQKGTIANIIMNANDISLRIVATVNSIRTGNPGNDRDLMPRLLEWLIARHEIELFWGATLYIFLIIFGTMKRWELI